MSNAEAIETLRANYPDACYEQLREAVDAAIEALKAQTAWVPVTERLPEDDSNCIVFSFRSMFFSRPLRRRRKSIGYEPHFA